MCDNSQAPVGIFDGCRPIPGTYCSKFSSMLFRAFSKDLISNWIRKVTSAAFVVEYGKNPLRI